MPLVSVILPTYNRAASIGGAIRSVLDQTVQDFEIVVVDDRSLDQTEEVVNRFRDRRIRYLRLARNSGEAASRNAGVLQAGGRYVAFLDDDDSWVPEKLALQLAEFDASGTVGLVYSWRETLFNLTGRSSVLPLSGDVESQLRRFRITTSTVVVSWEALSTAGRFDEAIPYSSDYDLWIRIWRAGFRFRAVDRPLVRYAVHGDGLSGNLHNVAIGKEMLLAKHYSFFTEDTESLSDIYRNLGVLKLFLGDARQARHLLGHSIRLRARLSNCAYYVLSFLGASAGRRLRELRGWSGSHDS
jgi:glycosyltransferase involved in cell wall biosynthesis